MKILLAEDGPTTALALATALRDWGYEVVVVHSGDQALAALLAPDAPRLAILDWMMPGLSGPEVCQQVRLRDAPGSPYLILLTVLDSLETKITGLDSGADDFVVKTSGIGDARELKARVAVGARVIGLRATLAARLHELEDAMSQVKRLQGLIPICAWCKNVRNDQNYWQRVDGYLAERSEVRFTHRVCPECAAKLTAPTT